MVSAGGILWCVEEEDSAVLRRKIIVNIEGGIFWCVLDMEDHVVYWRWKIKACFRDECSQ
jgi:hypothetical protein